jgi:hypothetical protein
MEKCALREGIRDFAWSDYGSFGCGRVYMWRVYRYLSIRVQVHVCVRASNLVSFLMIARARSLSLYTHMLPESPYTCSR